MRSENYWKRIITLILILLGSFFVENSFGQGGTINPCNLTVNTIVESRKAAQYNGRTNDRGIGSIAIDSAYSPKNFREDKPKTYPAGTKPLQIISKPIAYYTDDARKNCIQGVVKLRITFFANGKVGKFKVVKGLPYGLTEQAVDMAKKLKFKPAMKNNKPITVTKTLQYNFTIY